MKAVIMAGGEGTRLRCVSGEVPKPLVPLLGRSMMEHIIMLLRENGFDDICVTLRYKADMIRAAFGDGSRLGVRICYRTEDEPRGTAGGVRNCADFYGDDDFLVISGDAACDYDLRSLMDCHKERKAAATLALCRHSEPLSYGLAVTDNEDNIRAFIEKPDWNHVVTDRVNTGIYVLSPAAMALVPESGQYDFARDLFPEMLRRGMTLIGRAMDGYWCDVGTPLTYYKCCVDALEGRLRVDIPESFRPGKSECNTDEGSFTAEYPCRDRAALMGTVSAALMELSPDYSDGITVTTPSCKLRIAPAADISALRIYADSRDAEFAKEFASAAKELIKALDKEE